MKVAKNSTGIMRTIIEYHWDNPSVDGDEVSGSPKIGFAEGIRLPGKDQIFIVGSGIYATDRSCP